MVKFGFKEYFVIDWFKSRLWRVQRGLTKRNRHDPDFGHWFREV